MLQKSTENKRTRPPRGSLKFKGCNITSFIITTHFQAFLQSVYAEINENCVGTELSTSQPPAFLYPEYEPEDEKTEQNTEGNNVEREH